MNSRNITVRTIQCEQYISYIYMNKQHSQYHIAVLVPDSGSQKVRGNSLLVLYNDILVLHVVSLCGGSRE